MPNYAILPKPVELQPQAGWFAVTHETILIADNANQGNAVYFRDFLAPAMGVSLSILADPDFQGKAIILKLDPALQNLGPEGYALSVQPQQIQIRAAHPAGVFYGLQTLRQLLPIEIENRIPKPGISWQIPCCQISDQPRFPWRGYMLDEGRHFQGKETVLQTLDLMALQKLNIFHWHLTEDQGWRIEIKRYPRLIDVGSHRPGTAQGLGDMLRGTHNGQPHAGYYTQEEIHQIVAYAAERHITIVPEIEIPGHCRAVIAAYPELSCNAADVQVATGPGIYKEIYCPGKETTFEFLQAVLDEIMALFPSEIIHIGGDEAPKARWKECPDCQRRIHTEGLKDEHDLQTYFTNRIAAYLKSHGRQVMGWNEILAGELDSEAIVQYWMRNKTGLLAAIKNGQKVVNSAYFDTYLDHSYALTPLKRAYQFEPVFSELDPESAANILGLEAPLWTEWVPSRARLNYQTYPRLTALAEVGWTARERRAYSDFRARLTYFRPRLDLLGVRYAPESAWAPDLLRRALGIFTIFQPQTGITHETHEA